MSLIYEPKGAAREYSPLALNLYNGCDHRCRYCYGKRFHGSPVATPRKDLLTKLRRELDRGPIPRKQVLLSFLGDPYCAANEKHGLTRSIVTELDFRGIPVAILTKGGTRCLQDLDLFEACSRLKVGATLTFFDERRSMEEEPGAASPGNRLEALEELHRRGIRTWASLEPVIDPAQTLDLIKISAPFVHTFMIGKLNHDRRARSIDWPAFGIQAVNLVRYSDRALYVKTALRAHLPPGFLRPEECDPDRHCLHA